MVYRIVKYLNNPILEQQASPVSEFGTTELREIVDSMFETMYSARGVGLAAPQVNLGLQLCVIDTTGGEPEEGEVQRKIVLINPQVIHKEGKQTGEEGCLSIPGFREPVTRAKKAVVRALDVEGNTFEIEGEDLLARAMLHEIDHLNGVLFLSHLSVLKRDLIKRKIKKLQKAGEWD